MSRDRNNNPDLAAVSFLVTLGIAAAPANSLLFAFDHDRASSEPSAKDTQRQTKNEHNRAKNMPRKSCGHKIKQPRRGF